MVSRLFAAICSTSGHAATAGSAECALPRRHEVGATGQEPLTWALNTHLPAIVCRKFTRSRIVAFSTGNIYGLVPATGGGSLETDPRADWRIRHELSGRERMLEHFSLTQGTKVGLIRLNYACDLRYGVLVDLAQKILVGAPVDLAMSWFNTIWQGDANAMTLRCIERVASPPLLLNLTGPELLNVRETCEKLGQLLGRKPVFVGMESPTALLSNARRALNWFGQPRVSARPVDRVGRRLAAPRRTDPEQAHAF